MGWSPTVLLLAFVAASAALVCSSAATDTALSGSRALRGHSGGRPLARFSAGLAARKLPAVVAGSRRHAHADETQHSTAAAADAEQHSWPGLSSKGVIVDRLRQSDPYASTGGAKHSAHQAAFVHVAFHLAITSCNSRQGWARMLSSTLLSVVASEVHPTTITIIWCRPWPGEGKEPSLFANWRLSHRIKVGTLKKQ